MTPRKIVICQPRAIPRAGGKSVPGCSICMCHTFLHEECARQAAEMLYPRGDAPMLNPVLAARITHCG
jgi:hypothetical protein